MENYLKSFSNQQNKSINNFYKKTEENFENFQFSHKRISSKENLNSSELNNTNFSEKKKNRILSNCKLQMKKIPFRCSRQNKEKSFLKKFENFLSKKNRFNFK